VTNDVCLFAHFDPTGRLGTHVRHYLQQIQHCGFDIVMAVSGHETVPEEIAAFCAASGITAVGRPNGGLDFGAWQHLMRAGFAENATTILLANDSVFGPLFPLRPVVDGLRRTGADAWGMVETLEMSWHLQSWFVGMTAAAFRSPGVQRVFAQPFDAMTKGEIILHGEIGLGSAFQAEKLRVVAARAAAQSVLDRLVPGNAMQIDWRSVVESRTVPFIKVEVLRDNPLCLPWVASWPDVVQTSDIFDESWITDWLARLPSTRPARRPKLITLVRALRSRDRGSLWATLRRIVARQVPGRRRPSSDS